MKLSNVLSGLAASLLASASLTGCIIVDNGDHSHSGYGSITVALTIDGRADRFQCFDYDVDGFVVSVEDEWGFVTEASADCDDFGLTLFDLPAGYYDVETWLVDFNGFPRSDIVRVELVDVYGGTDTLVRVDFPWTWIDP